MPNSLGSTQLDMEYMHEAAESWQSNDKCYTILARGLSI